MEYLQYFQKLSLDVISGLKGNYGNVGIYGSFLRIFISFGLLSGPASSLIDAPFGRAVTSISSGRFNGYVNGNIGWLIMEIISPLSFLIGFSSKLSSTPIIFSLSSLPSISTIIDPFHKLPKARVLLASLFLLHYFNRSILSTFRNPGRSKMHLSVPISAIIFNVINGFLMGFNLSGGGVGDWCYNSFNNWGINEDPPFEALFIVGISLWTIGFISNIICDEILYSLKRNRSTSSPSPTSSSSTPTTTKNSHWQPHRYSIPHGFLYSYPFGGISSPSYFSEWIEWTGFALACYSLSPAPFPLLALTPPSFFVSLVKRPSKAMSLIRNLPIHLRPFEEWFLSPPFLFLWNEISAMLPRALSTHSWYQKKFGREYPRGRKAIIPGIL